MINFESLLTAKQLDNIRLLDEQKSKYNNLTDSNLISTLKYFMSQCSEPARSASVGVCYDSAVWFVLLPELVRRFEESIIDE